MAFVIPTTQEIKNANFAGLENAINQSSPVNDRAFLRVLAAIEAMNHIPLYRYALERSMQNLALTATDEDLERIGEEHGVIRKSAESCVIGATISGTDGISISPDIAFTGVANGLRYYQTTTSIVTGGYAILNLTCSVSGSAGTLSIGDSLKISSQIAGLNTTAIIANIVIEGAEREDSEIYRSRILFKIRSSRGGGNATDYKLWAEEVAGVKRAFPYAGHFTDNLPDGTPPQRTVFVETTTDISDDGIATEALLDEVRAYINYDPETLTYRQPLGLTDDDLYVESIIRTEFNVIITGLSVTPSLLDQAKTDIAAALTIYFSNLVCFVSGIDQELYRNDIVTAMTISKIVQDTLISYGATAISVTFNRDGETLTSYQLLSGELAKLGEVTYMV
jgi:uncharacterized phage protein gp47/JayE